MSPALSLLPVVLFSFFILFVFVIAIVFFSFYYHKAPIRRQNYNTESTSQETPVEEQNQD